LHADKRELVAGILDGADQAGKLSTQELVAMIRCGGQAPADAQPPANGAKAKEPAKRATAAKCAKGTRFNWRSKRA
jgi:hypothetical protein